MKISFKKDYGDDTMWGAVVSDFIDYLGSVYGYTIDEFDLTSMPQRKALSNLGKLIDEGSKSPDLSFEFSVACQKLFAAERRGMEMRREAMRIWEASCPVNQTKGTKPKKRKKK